MAPRPFGHLVEVEPAARTEVSEVGHEVRDIGLIVGLPSVAGYAGVVTHSSLSAPGSPGVAGFRFLAHHDPFR